MRLYNQSLLFATLIHELEELQAETKREAINGGVTA
jgi:hypothetical protein